MSCGYIMRSLETVVCQDFGVSLPISENGSRSLGRSVLDARRRSRHNVRAGGNHQYRKLYSGRLKTYIMGCYKEGDFSGWEGMYEEHHLVRGCETGLCVLTS